MYDGLSLLDFIPKLSPELSAPYHLSEWCHLIEQASKDPVRGLCACPIRHYKTTTTLHGIVWLLIQDPSLRIILFTHSHERAQTLGKQLRVLAEGAGVGPVRGWNTIDEWRNKDDGGVVIMSAEQSKLGYDCHVLVFDDPLDEDQWDDPVSRDAVDRAIAHYTARCMRKGRPGPVLGVASRGHPDDPIGRRLFRQAAAWTYVHYPAIIDEDTEEERAFAPDVWPLDALKAMRAELKEVDPTERIWWAQLQGNPKPIGLSKFRPDPDRYDKMPDWNYRLGYGLDMAYTSNEGSDYFAICAFKVCGTKAFILEVARYKLDAHIIESTCKMFMAKYGFGPMFSYVSGPELGMVSVLRERGLPIVPIRARYNKLVRAERSIKRWNDLQVAVPQDAPWVHGFLHRVEIFRGLEKARDDDEIDAMVSGLDGMMGGAAAGSTKTMGRSYQGMGFAGGIHGQTERSAPGSFWKWSG